jgi:hypothetical protein
MAHEVIHLDHRWQLAGFDGYGETIDTTTLPAALPNLPLDRRSRSRIGISGPHAGRLARGCVHRLQLARGPMGRAALLVLPNDVQRSPTRQPPLPPGVRLPGSRRQNIPERCAHRHALQRFPTLPNRHHPPTTRDRQRPHRLRRRGTARQSPTNPAAATTAK